jgi:hypothetical protein
VGEFAGADHKGLYRCVITLDTSTYIEWMLHCYLQVATGHNWPTYTEPFILIS